MNKKIKSYPINPNTPRSKRVDTQKLEPIEQNMYDDYGYVLSVEKINSTKSNPSDSKE